MCVSEAAQALGAWAYFVKSPLHFVSEQWRNCVFPEALTVFHSSGQKQGSWRLDAQTLERPPTATHHADSHPADKPEEKDNDKETDRSRLMRENTNLPF